MSTRSDSTVPPPAPVSNRAEAMSKGRQADSARRRQRVITVLNKAAVNRLAAAALLATYTTHKTIADTTAVRAAITEVNDQ